MELDPRTPDLIMHQIAQNGYTTGEATAADPRCGLVWMLDASNQSGDIWAVVAEDRLVAASELWISIGLDFLE
ncbi:MAG: hypothetical protein IID32_06215 [Planctomycetes bacterium]|nr:hypothetical protein [Planctomycetota bacterium]